MNWTVDASAIMSFRDGSQWSNVSRTFAFVLDMVRESTDVARFAAETSSQ